MTEDEREKIEYISLAQAAELCAYSQEYLSLRARQGKLKSVKLGRNWVTRRIWLEDYIKTIEAYNGKNGKALKEKIPQELVAETLIVPEEKKDAEPPENLPTGEPMLQPVLKEVIYPFSLRIAFAASLLILAIVIGAVALLPFFDRESWQFTMSLMRDYGLWFVGAISGIPIDFSAHEIAQGIAQINLETAANTFLKAARVIKEDFSVALGFLSERLKSFVGREEEPVAEQHISVTRLGGRTEELEQNIIGDIQRRFGEFRGVMGLSEREREGLIAIPSTGKDEEMKEKIMRSFSDEVVIEQKDETSGIIRPVFRTIAEQAYLYLMVPIRN